MVLLSMILIDPIDGDLKVAIFFDIEYRRRHGIQPKLLCVLRRTVFDDLRLKLSVRFCYDVEYGTYSV